MFLGEFSHAIDDKGRLTIPARFRTALIAGAVVTRGFDRHLTIYTSDSFQKLVEKARTLSATRPENRALFRLLFSGASEVILDKSNRINIPGFLRSYATLDGEAVVVGAGDYVEVWNPAAWQEQLDLVNDPATNTERFAALDLAPGNLG